MLIWIIWRKTFLDFNQFDCENHEKSVKNLWHSVWSTNFRGQKNIFFFRWEKKVFFLFRKISFVINCYANKITRVWISLNKRSKSILFSYKNERKSVKNLWFICLKNKKEYFFSEKKEKKKRFFIKENLKREKRIYQHCIIYIIW